MTGMNRLARMNDEDYIAELEQSNEALNAQVKVLTDERERLRQKAAFARQRSDTQDAITAWAMGFE